MLLWRNLPSIKIPFVKLITISALIICAAGPFHAWRTAQKKDSGFPLSFSLIENSERILVRFWQYMNSKKPRRVCRPQAAKNSNHFSPRHVRGEKYLSDCKCGIFALRAKIMRAAGCNPFVGKIQRIFRQGKSGVPEARDPTIFAFMRYASANQHFSNTTAVPMPPPMHRVARPFLASGRFCISCSRVTMIRAPEAPTG